MIVFFTEDQAREKWYPFVRHVGITADVDSYNRHDEVENPRYANCIASECMMR